VELKINPMNEDFDYTKNIVDKIISQEEEFTLKYVKDEIRKNDGVMHVAENCGVEEYLLGLAEIGDLNYDFFEDMYKTKNKHVIKINCIVGFK